MIVGRELRLDPEPHLGRLVWLVFAVVPLVIAGQVTAIGTVDAWWNFGLGHLMWDQHRVIVEDPYSFTPTVTGVINQQWLAQLLWAAAYDLAGDTGVNVLRAIAIAAMGLALWSVGRRLGASRRALVAATLLSCALIASNLGIRAQTLAFPLAALTLWGLQRGGRSRWVVVPLTILWANVHGSFPLAITFAGAFTIGSLIAGQRCTAFDYALVTIGAVIATFVTPYGLQVWRYVFDMSTNEAIHSVITEWAPTTLQPATGKVFFAEVVAAGCILGVRRTRLPPPWLMIGAGLCVFALTAVRDVVWVGIVSLPIWAILLSSAFQVFADHPTTRRTLMLMGAVLLGMATMAALPARTLQLGQAGRSALDEEIALVDLSNYLQAHPGGRMFHDVDWGAYLEAHLAPQQQVFIDTRFEVHPPEVWDDYSALVSARFDWQSILDRYGVVRVVIDPERTAFLAQALNESARWRQSHVIERGDRHIVVWDRT